MVKHEVYENSRDRNVEPERKSPAGDGAMAVKTLAQRPDQSDDHQGNDRGGQHNVRNQNRKVDRPRPSGALKSHRADMRVVIEIRDQKHCRCNHRCNHRRVMGSDSTLADEPSAHEQEDGAGSIQGGVHGREDSVSNGDGHIGYLCVRCDLRINRFPTDKPIECAVSLLNNTQYLEKAGVFKTVDSFTFD